MLNKQFVLWFLKMLLMTKRNMPEGCCYKNPNVLSTFSSGLTMIPASQQGHHMADGGKELDGSIKLRGINGPFQNSLPWICPSSRSDTLSKAINNDAKNAKFPS